MTDINAVNIANASLLVELIAQLERNGALTSTEVDNLYAEVIHRNKSEGTKFNADAAAYLKEAWDSHKADRQP